MENIKDDADGVVVRRSSRSCGFVALGSAKGRGIVACIDEVLSYSVVVVDNQADGSVMFAMDIDGKDRAEKHKKRRKRLYRAILYPLLLFIPQIQPVIDVDTLDDPYFYDKVDSSRRSLLQVSIALDTVVWVAAVLTQGFCSSCGVIPSWVFVRPISLSWKRQSFGYLLLAFFVTSYCGIRAARSADRRGLAAYVCLTSMASIITCLVFPSPLVFFRFLPAYLAWLML
uniref:Uncharacterized protein n=1 Tax=Compsopogon caeruleus TaxID=31354 RepID=A0A7S1XGL8_9RHOD